MSAPIPTHLPTPDPLEPLRNLRLALTVAALSNAVEIDELVPLVHPDIAVPAVPSVAPGPGYDGIAGLRRYFAEATANNFLAQAALSNATVTPAGNVLASGALLLHAHGNVESAPVWIVYRFRDGLVSAIETYLDRIAASTAAAERGPGSPARERTAEPGRV